LGGNRSKVPVLSREKYRAAMAIPLWYVLARRPSVGAPRFDRLCVCSMEMFSFR